MIVNLISLSIILSSFLTFASTLFFIMRSLYLTIDKNSPDYFFGGVNAIIFMISLFAVVILSNLSNNIVVERATTTIYEQPKVTNSVQK